MSSSHGGVSSQANPRGQTGRGWPLGALWPTPGGTRLCLPTSSTYPRSLVDRPHLHRLSALARAFRLACWVDTGVGSREPHGPGQLQLLSLICCSLTPLSLGAVRIWKRVRNSPKDLNCPTQGLLAACAQGQHGNGTTASHHSRKLYRTASV